DIGGELLAAHLVRAVEQIAPLEDFVDGAFAAALKTDAYMIADRCSGFFPSGKAMACRAVVQRHDEVASVGRDDAADALGLSHGRDCWPVPGAGCARRLADGCRRRPSAADRASAWPRCRHRA